ncbi:MAG: cation diffusion facilitator family transporter [bacterium]
MPMLIAAAGGLVTEFISMRLLYSGQKGDLNIKGAFWHVIQTFVGSVLIIVTAVVIELTGFLAIDPILGMAFGLVLLWASWGIMRDAVVILMEGAPSGIDLRQVIARLEALPGVSDVHHVHAWTLTSNKHVFSAHMRATNNEAAPGILKEAHRLLRKEFGFHFVTLQIETVCLDEEHAKDLDFLEAEGRATQES